MGNFVSKQNDGKKRRKNKNELKKEKENEDDVVYRKRVESL